MRGILEGDPKIVSQFYSDNLPKVTRYIAKNSGDAADAQDIFQDAMILVYQKLNNRSLQLNCTLGTYVFAVCRNLWMNALRKKRKMVLNDTIMEISKDTNDSIIESLFQIEKKLLYQKHFANLGQQCKIVLKHFFDGTSMQNISKLMGYSEGYTRKKKFECKKKLLVMIEKDPLFNELNFDHTQPSQ